MEYTFNTDTFDAAEALGRHLRQLEAGGLDEEGANAVVVVGGGLTGMEVVTSLHDRLNRQRQEGRLFQLILVDGTRDFPAGYAPESQRYVQARLNALGIRLKLTEQVASVGRDHVSLASGAVIKTRTVVWCAGMAANPLTGRLPGERDALGRLSVDGYLRLPARQDIFVAGDAARALVDDTHYAVMSCQHAMPQGKVAGHNAVCQLLGLPLKTYTQPDYATCLDLGYDDALFTLGWERHLDKTGQEAKALKAQILSQWIYPSADIDETLAMSAPGS